MTSRIVKSELTKHVTATAGDNVPAEIEYRDKEGNVVGFWAYGSWHPDYPYQGKDILVKTFIHTGPGIYVGSCVIVQAETLKDAVSLIRETLDNGDLADEEICEDKIEIIEFSQTPQVIYVR